MPMIRKKTSNRKGVSDREKLKKKVRDGRKKNIKLAKKNPQWKSKHKKDPGIPNEFPYKDQILAEVAEQRRIAAEDKQRRKDEKQKNFERARAIARGEIVPDEDMESAEEGSDAEEGSEGDAEEQSSDEEEGAPKMKSKKDLNVGADSIASLSAKQMNIKLKARPKPQAVEEVVEEEDVPVLINRDLPNLLSVIDKADVVVELLDARDPEAFRNKNLEDLVVKKGKKLLLILNKIDTCPKESVSSWIELLRKQHPTLAFRSATSFLPETSNAQVISSLSSKTKGKSRAKAPTNDAVGRDVVLDCLSTWRKDSGKDEFNVAVVGIVNAGKTAFINSVNKRATLPVYTLATSSRGPSTTELPQEVVLEVAQQKFTFIDTPGLSFLSDEETDPLLLNEFRSRDILLRSKGRIDRLKDPHPPVEHIVSRANTEDLMVLYSLPAFLKGDPTAFMAGVARANQMIKKKGELDLSGAARIVLRDWNIGKFAKYSMPPSTKTGAGDATLSASGSSTASAQLQELYAKQDAVIAGLTPRKELRKKIGLVKLTPSTIDTREPALEESWAALNVNEESDDDAEGEDEDGMEVDGEGEMVSDEDVEGDSDVEMEGDEDEDEEEEEVPPPPVSISKRKRGPERAAPTPPAKKVAFTSKRAINEAAKVDALKEKAAQQAPKPAQSAAIPVKSALKTLKTKKAPPAKSSEDKSKGAANVPSAKSVKAKATATTEKKTSGEAEAYDFGKFF